MLLPEPLEPTKATHSPAADLDAEVGQGRGRRSRYAKPTLPNAISSASRGNVSRGRVDDLWPLVEELRDVLQPADPLDERGTYRVTSAIE